MKNIVLILSFIISSFCVFAQGNSETDTITVNPKYKAIDNILKSDLPNHQQKRNTADSSDKTTNIRICAPSRANVISALIIVNYGNKIHKSTDDKNGGVLNKINPNYIAAISVLKDAEKIKKYGDDGKGGVVIITIKEENVADFAKYLKQRKKN